MRRRKSGANRIKIGDLPPSYSQMDLFSLGIPVADHLNPPPNYPESLQYLDLESGHSKMKKQASRLSVRSCAVSHFQKTQV